MRRPHACRSLPLCAVAVAAVASVGAADARAQGWSEPDPAAVVGRWSGAVRWQRCAIDGAAKVELDVVRDGSGYAIDLAGLIDGFGREVFAATGGPTLEANHADLRATWRAGKPARATLEVVLGGGCTAVATLRRASVGAPACDELVALAAIAGTCEALTEPLAPTTVELVARLRGRGLPGKKARPACVQAAAPLRTALVDAGCVPAPLPPVTGPRIPECDALIATVLHAVRCDKISIEIKQRLSAQLRIVGRSAAVGDPDARAALVDSCRETATSLDELVKRLGC